MEIGLLIKSKIPDADIPFYGNIKTMEVTLKNFELKRNPYKSDENSKHPHYIIYLKGLDNTEIAIGAGWYRTYVRNGVEGEMISLTFDDPSFKHSLNVTAFKGSDEYRWPITWKRERAKA